MKKYRCEVYSNTGVLLFKTNYQGRIRNHVVKKHLKHRFSEFIIKIKSRKHDTK